MNGKPGDGVGMNKEERKTISGDSKLGETKDVPYGIRNCMCRKLDLAEI